MEVRTHGEQGYDESFSGVEHRLKSYLNESGLEAGEIVQLQGEKYRVLAGDDGLRIEPISKPVGEKKKARRR